MITQYVSTSSLPSQVQEYIISHVGIFDKYIGFYTGANTIDFVVSPAFGDPYCYHFFRDGTYNSLWQVSKSSTDFSYIVSNVVYCYDNLGLGHELTSSHVDNMFLSSLVFILCLIILFKRGLTKWLRN